MKMNNNKIIIVAGGAGFIGSNLCRRLLKDGNKVICIDNLSSGLESNIRDLYINSDFLFIEHDIIEPFSHNIDCDEIYNFACPASPKFYQKDCLNTLFTNMYGMKNLLDLATRNNAVILQASTSEIYGDAKIHPQKESYFGNVNPNGVRSCYDEGKRVAETLCLSYQKEKGTKIKIIRIFNTYGPYMRIDDGRVISTFISQAIKGESLSIYGKGKQTRSFCYIEDLLDGIDKIMKSEEVGPINLGNPEEISIKKLAKLIIKLTHSSSKFKYCELPADDPIRRKPDITKANRELKWKPKVGIEDGVKKYIDFIQNNL